MNITVSGLWITVPLFIAAILLAVFGEQLLSAICCGFVIWAVVVDTEIEFIANREFVSLSIQSSKKGGV